MKNASKGRKTSTNQTNQGLHEGKASMGGILSQALRITNQTQIQFYGVRSEQKWHTNVIIIIF